MLKKWTETYIPLLKQHLSGQAVTIGMFGADSTKALSSSQQKALDLAFHNGIPREIRSIVWSVIVPNSLKITEKLYKVLIDRAKLCQENAEKDTAFRKNQKVIEEDLHRTYSEMNIFRFGNKLY